MENFNVLYTPSEDLKGKFVERYGKRVYLSDDSDYGRVEADWEKKSGIINGKEMAKDDFVYMIAKLNRKMLTFVSDMYREMLKSPLNIYSIRLIGNANCPIVVFNNDFSLTLYRKNAVLYFSDASYNGDVVGSINMNDWFGKVSEAKKHDIVMTVLESIQRVNVRDIYKIYNAVCPERSPLCYSGHDGISPLWGEFTPMLFSCEAYAYKELDWLTDNSINLVKCFVKTSTKRQNVINRMTDSEIRKYLAMTFPSLYTDKEVEDITTDCGELIWYDNVEAEAQPEDIVNVAHMDIYGV